MAHEIETKVLNIDIEKISAELERQGASKTQQTRLVVDWYRIKGIKAGEDPWYLRIRSYDGKKHEVTWKAKSDVIGIARKHKEINFMIEEPKKLADLFEELNLECYAHQEKDRVSFSLNDWTFDIDQYPGMPAYMEIEGKSEEHIQQAISLLGLESHTTSPEGERKVIEQEYGLNWYDMRF